MCAQVRVNPTLTHFCPRHKMGFLPLETPVRSCLRLAAIFLLMAQGLLHAQTLAVFGATDINGGSANLRASLSNPNNVNLLGCGVVLAPTLVNPNPWRGGTGTTQITRNDLAAGPFQLEAAGLSKNTRYSFKAYATYASGTNYSTAATFTTLANHIPVLNADGAGNVPAFSSTGSLGEARSYHAAVRLADGRVLVAGGSTGTSPIFNSAELYDPETAGWTTTGTLLIARDSPRATLLSNGHVLLSGGFTPTTTTDSAEIYNPATGIWNLTGRMLSPRYGQTSTLLQDSAGRGWSGRFQ